MYSRVGRPAPLHCTAVGKVLVAGRPRSEWRQIAERIPGCRLEILRGCGHWTTIEKPDECNDLLRRFYDTNRR